MSHPVSVICCTYNRPELLSTALRSLHTQNTSDFEVVVVNDGGVDVGEVVMRELRDVSYQYHSLPRNLGLAAAIEYAIEHSQGQYLMFIDDDNEFLPSHIKTLLEVANQQQAALVYSDSIWRHYHDGRVVHEGIWAWDYSYHTLNFLNYIDPVQVILDKSQLRAIGGFDHALRVSDWDLWLRLRAVAPIVHVPEVTCVYGLYDHVTRLSASLSDFKPDVERMISKYLSPGEKSLHEAAACLRFTHFDDLDALALIPKESRDATSLSQMTLTAMIYRKQQRDSEAHSLLQSAFKQAAQEDPVFKLLVAGRLLNELPFDERLSLLESLLLDDGVRATPQYAGIARAYLNQVFHPHRLRGWLNRLSVTLRLDASRAHVVDRARRFIAQNPTSAN